MNTHVSRTKTKILIIDRQENWRNASVKQLHEAGYSVSALPDYHLWHSELSGQPRQDLVVLGCPSIGEDEQRLIARLLSDRQNLVVLCTSLPPQVMRSLFIAGASDVADKPYEPAHVVEVVRQALDSLISRDCYRRTEEAGL